MSRIKVYYIIPGMDAAYYVVFRWVSPELTVGALAAKLKNAWADELDAGEVDWVGRCRREWALPTVTMGQLRAQGPPGKELKIKYVARSIYEQRLTEFESTAKQQLVRVASTSGAKTRFLSAMASDILQSLRSIGTEHWLSSLIAPSGPRQNFADWEFGL